MKIYKVEAEGDVVYLEAVDINKAYERIQKMMGPIPEELLTFNVVKKVPKGEELL